MEYTPPPKVVAVEPEALARCAGQYRLPAGDQIVVAVERGGLMLRGDGGEALSLLTTGRRGESKALTAIQDRTQAILTAVDKGEFEPLRAAFGGDRTIEEVKQMELEHRREMTAKHGPYKSFQVMGTVDAGESRFTFVKLIYERGHEFLRFRWEDGGLVGIRGAAGVGTARFMPQSPTEFTSFSLTSPDSVRIGFQMGPSGSATALSFHSGDGVVVASRVD